MTGRLRSRADYPIIVSYGSDELVVPPRGEVVIVNRSLLQKDLPLKLTFIQD